MVAQQRSRRVDCFDSTARRAWRSSHLQSDDAALRATSHHPQAAIDSAALQAKPVC
jgi:hypothetical protein